LRDEGVVGVIAVTDGEMGVAILDGERGCTFTEEME
jgi:hypothetical protein